MSDEERFRRALEDIANHFDDQGFPPHGGNCAETMVNYAGEVLSGYDGYMGDWYAERVYPAMADAQESHDGLDAPGPDIAGAQVSVRVGAFNYYFEKNEDETLSYAGRYPIDMVDDDDEKPFDPSEYR